MKTTSPSNGQGAKREPKPTLRVLAQATQSMGLPKAALPIMEELFADQTSLGAPPRRVASWLVDANVGPSSRVLDLGCGKGSVALAIARRSGAHVRGIDAFPPFIEDARRRAVSLGLSSRCEFILGDLWAERVTPRRRYDAVVMLNIAATSDALPLIHRLLRPGGVCVIDDAVGISRHALSPASGDPDDVMPPHLIQAREQFHSAGYQILRQHIFTPARVRASTKKIVQSLVRRARIIRKHHPAMHKVALECLNNHRQAAATLTGPIRPVMWMLRRAK